MNGTEREYCPECESGDTEQVYVDWEVDSVVEIRVCHNCGCEWENDFGKPVKRVNQHGE